MNNLKRMRIKKGLTQYEVAYTLGITVRAYQYIEYGQKKPSYNVILKLQELFKSNIDSLLSEADITD